jgi:hypothetical protein
MWCAWVTALTSDAAGELERGVDTAPDKPRHRSPPVALRFDCAARRLDFISL